jgi:hypothetical protein
VSVFSHRVAIMAQSPVCSRHDALVGGREIG